MAANLRQQKVFISLAWMMRRRGEECCRGSMKKVESWQMASSAKVSAIQMRLYMFVALHARTHLPHVCISVYICLYVCMFLCIYKCVVWYSGTATLQSFYCSKLLQLMVWLTQRYLQELTVLATSWRVGLFCFCNYFIFICRHNGLQFFFYIFLGFSLRL